MTISDNLLIRIEVEGIIWHCLIIIQLLYKKSH